MHCMQAVRRNNNHNNRNNIAGNYEIYRQPVTSAQDIGEWNKDEPLRQREPWTYVRRRVHLDSEMTRYLPLTSDARL